MNNQFSERLKQLNTLQTQLKIKFIGLDETIDKIIEQITPWFVYQIPREAPLIINIWGITGTGKTELVSDICSGLNLSTTFFDSQIFLGTNGIVARALRFSNSNPQAIIIDEFHRLKTKNEDRQQNDNRFRLWEILTGGIKLNYSFELALDRAKRELYYTKNAQTTDADKSTELKKLIRSIHADFYDKAFYYEHYPLSEERETEFNQLYEQNQDKTFLEYIQALTQFAESLPKVENISTKNNLIFVMGNLDSAYSAVVDDIETLDADELSSSLAKISAQACKEALLNMFAPEQVSRLGANHIVMPTLTKASYQGVINKKIKSLCELYEKTFGLTLVIDNSVREMVYDQIVVPSQGMRNVFSGFNALLDTPVSLILGKLIEFKNHPIFVSFKNDHLSFEVVDKTFTQKVELIKKSAAHSKEWNRQIAIHEAGHALIYYLVNKESPLKVVVETSTQGSAGYIKKKQREFSNKQNMLDDLMVSFGGYFAEQVIYGENFICSGSYSDLKKASFQLSQMVNSLGMGKKITPHRLGSQFETPFLRTLEKEKDKEIQDIFEAQAIATEKLLKENKSTLEKLATWLQEKKRVTQQQMDAFMASIQPEDASTEEVANFIYPERELDLAGELRHLNKNDNKKLG